MKKGILILTLFVLAVACKKDDSIDPKLLGKWSDFNVRYTFNGDYTYAVNYLRTGAGQDSVLVDSVFGTYSLDRKRDNITFNQKGYRERYSGNIISQEKYANTWNYSFETDTILKYTSNTTLGVLYKE